MLDVKAIEKTEDFCLSAGALDPNLEVLAVSNVYMGKYSSSLFMISLSSYQSSGLSEIKDFETYADYLRHIHISFPRISLASVNPHKLFILLGSYVWIIFIFLVKFL
jgi:hypothetical protein